jgi:predicted MFS family arabinose efflux permease
MGATTVVTQMIVPFAALIARPEERGRAVGTVVSGLLVGTLLARTVSGLISAALGWRAVYWMAAALMLALLITLYLTLPQEPPRTKLSYTALLRSLWSLVGTETLLRDIVPFGVLASASFSAFWVTLTFFLSSPTYHFSSNVIGLFGLVGVVGAFTASLVGKRADRQNPRVLTGIMLGIIFLSFVLFWLLGQWLWGMIMGVILFDLGIQGAHVSNQARIYARPQEIHSRLTTIYMFSYFVGGSLGAALGTAAWSGTGWPGVCALGVLLLGLALVVFFVRRHRG